MNDRQAWDGAPSISVLIPVRDGAAYLGEAIDSALSQSCRPAEVVVVDDGSQDDTRRIAERYGAEVTYVPQEPLGISAARNRAVGVSTGALLAFLDADDLFEPDRLRVMSSALVVNATLEAVFGCVTEFVQPGLSQQTMTALRRPRERQPSHLITAMLIRRSAFERVGPFEMDQSVNLTVEWYARALAAELQGAMLDEVVLRRRLHGANVGITRWDSGQQLVSIARASLERRRAAGTDRTARADER